MSGIITSDSVPVQLPDLQGNCGHLHPAKESSAFDRHRERFSPQKGSSWSYHPIHSVAFLALNCCHILSRRDADKSLETVGEMTLAAEPVSKDTSTIGMPTASNRCASRIRTLSRYACGGIPLRCERRAADDRGSNERARKFRQGGALCEVRFDEFTRLWLSLKAARDQAFAERSSIANCSRVE